MNGLELLPLDPSVEDEARELYLSAFPVRERIPFDTLLRMAEGPDCRFLWMSVDGRFSGLVYLVESERLVFLMYLAVSPGSRCSGLGSDAVWLVKCGCGGRRLFLNIEPTDEPAENIGQRLRRTRFYERNGFSPQCNYNTPDGVRYTLLSWGGPVTPEEATDFYGSHMSLISE